MPKKKPEPKKKAKPRAPGPKPVPVNQDPRVLELDDMSLAKKVCVVRDLAKCYEQTIGAKDVRELRVELLRMFRLAKGCVEQLEHALKDAEVRRGRDVVHEQHRSDNELRYAMASALRINGYENEFDEHQAPRAVESLRDLLSDILEAMTVARRERNALVTTLANLRRRVDFQDQACVGLKDEA